MGGPRPVRPERRMAAAVTRPAGASLETAGLAPQREVHWNLTPAALYEHAVRRREGVIAAAGPFCAVTPPHPGRSPGDKFVVREASSEARIWWGKGNRPPGREHYERLERDVLTHRNAQELLVGALQAGADPAYRLPVRFVTPNAWQSLFVSNMFLRPGVSDLATFVPGFLVLHAPEMQADPKIHGTKSGTFIVLNFACKTILIGGTRYAGELKKAIFTILNYLLPGQGVLPMHCSSNLGEGGDVALFFGLSGTGKTTLSADPLRGLIGDDEHGWSDEGVFNFEGGCYAKCIKMSKEREPMIWDAIKFGAVIETVVINPDTRVPDYNDDSVTQNTRCAYPLDSIPNVVPSGMGGHPKAIIFLACDAFGVMPPVARLSP